MTDENYFSDKTRFSSSGIKHILKSPEHYQYYLFNGIETTEKMNHGKFIHTATMEETEIHKRFRLLNDTRIQANADGKIEFRSAINKGIRDEFINKCQLDNVTAIIKKEDWQEIITTAGNVSKSPIYRQIFSDAEVEKEFKWIDPEFNIPMKGKLDLFKILSGFAIIGDLKKLPDIDIDSMKTYIKHRDRLIHAQLAVYTEAVQVVLGLETKYHIVIGCHKESQQNGFFLIPQFADEGTPYWQDYSINEGKSIYNKAKQIYRDCIDRFGNPWDNGVKWPGVEYWSKNQYGLIEL
jgi:hypothetical protein